MTAAQTVTPMLTYADGPAAMDWLVATFGFTETARWLDDTGRVSHGELAIGGGTVMVASTIDGYQGPTDHRRNCPASDAWLRTPWVVDGVLVLVDDVDAHYRRSRAAGARLLSDVEDGGVGRLYRAEDLEGHRWMFLQRGDGGA